MDSRRIKVLVDTNVLIDFVNASRPGHDLAKEVFQFIFSHDVEAAVTTQSVMDTAYLSGKGSPETMKQVRETLRYILLHTNASYIDSIEARLALENPNPDIEDSAHLIFAEVECCDIILTNDKKLLARPVPAPMKVMTPEAFVNNCRA